MPRAAAAAAGLVLLLALSRTVAAVLLSQRPGNVLTLILTDCAEYQDWQTIAAAFSWRQSGQPGSAVRVANCKEEDRDKIDPHTLDYVQTHIAKQYAWYEPLKDWYAAYNKPGAVVDFFEHNNPAEEWVVVLDSDMLLKTPFVPEQLPLERGWSYAPYYSYLAGVNNQLALRHVPEIPPRNDTFAGPVGRRGDQVGGPYYMHRDDLKMLAPQWLNYTYIMRGDMEAYKDSGDTASKEGERIWIAEMYGYSFGAAKSNVWHKWHHDFMLYPSYSPSEIPHVLHYGLIYNVGEWQFDKHWYFDFDVHKCPTWDLSGKPKAGIFPPPPYPDKLPKQDFLDTYRDLLAISVVSVVNAAMCDYHVRSCPPSPQLTEVCDEVFKLYHAVDSALKDYEWEFDCKDHSHNCKGWAESGECEKGNVQYMKDHCKESCKYCTAKGPRPKDNVELHPLSVAAISKEIGVTSAQPGTTSAADTAAAEAAKKVAAGKATAEKAAADKAAADKAAAKKAAAEKAAADKAAADKAAADKAAAEKAAAEKAAAEKAAADKAAAKKAAPDTTAPEKVTVYKAAAQQPPTQPPAEVATGADLLSLQRELRHKYSPSSLSYPALVKRCTHLKGLDDIQLVTCLKAASFRLLYVETSASQPNGADAGSGAASFQGAHDLMSLHASQKWEHSMDRMLGRGMVAEGSWAIYELGFVVFGLMAFVYVAARGFRLAGTKHRKRI